MAQGHYTPMLVSGDSFSFNVKEGSPCAKKDSRPLERHRKFVYRHTVGTQGVSTLLEYQTQ